MIVDSPSTEWTTRDVGLRPSTVYIVHKYISNSLTKVCSTVGLSKSVEAEDIFLWIVNISINRFNVVQRLLYI